MCKNLSVLAMALFFAASTSYAQADSTALDHFWQNLQAHCGLAFSGVVTSTPEGDTQLAGVQEVVVHFEGCAENYIRVPFHVQKDDGTWNRSRTWFFIRTDDGIELRHDHRKEDGTEDTSTWYGGFSHKDVQAVQAEFVSSRERTSSDGPASGWRVIMEPGQRYVYGTIRQGEWRHRLDFDLSSPVATPELPWGYQTLPVGLQN